MSVVKSWVAGKLRDVESTAVELRKEAMELLIEGICQNTSGSVFQPDGATEPEVTGSPTETAVLAWGLKVS
jgi:Ca2+-transporting ATPase